MARSGVAVTWPSRKNIKILDGHAPKRSLAMTINKKFEL